MSDERQDDVEQTEQAEQAEQPTQPDTGAEDAGEPDYKAEFEKWKALARKHEQQAKANADKAKRLDDLEEANKSEQQKLADKASEAEKRAQQAEAKALRFEVATEKGVPKKAMKFLTGETQEELESQADEILELLGETQQSESPQRTPRERLRPGASDSGPQPDPKKIADSVMRGGL